MNRLVLISSATITAAVAGLPAQTPSPAVVIVRPEARAVLSGPSSLEADVQPESAGVRRVTFFVDGQPVCRAEARPFQCDWDAGVQAGPRTVRVVADLVGGERLVRTRRTSPRGLTFGASTDAVLVPVRVTDRAGNFIHGLDMTQFRVFEDGRPQQIVSMMSEGVRASVVLALDMSASMRSKLGDLRTAALAFLDAVRPDTALWVAGFNDGLFPLTSPTAETAARQEALSQLRPWGDTALYDSLIRAAGLVREQSSPRAIVAFTDGDDVSSRSSVPTVRSVLQASDAVLYLVVGADVPPEGSPLARLAHIAEETGGHAWFAPRMETLGRHFVDIVRDLTSGYVLSYVPDRPVGDGRWRQLRVELADGSTQYDIRARLGYLATEN